jgi:nucleoside-diphosphate-sugar epimerase
MTRQKILITGWSGFIGQNLLPRLASSHSVCLLRSDLRDHAAIMKEVVDAAPDMVIHLAARTEVEQSFYEQTTFSDINYVGTVNLIESMMKCARVPKLIFASTMEVFGWQPISDEILQDRIPSVLPVFDPDHTVPHPNAPYAVAKLACEHYIEYAHRISGMQYAIIRQTNTFGRSGNNFFVTEQIITQMLQDPQRCRLGYRQPFRNFLHVDDLIDAWHIVIDQFDIIKNQRYTVGPNNAISIENYARLIADMLHWKGDIEWHSKPERPGEIYFLNSSSDKLTNLTGWAPKISLDEGLQRTIKLWQNETRYPLQHKYEESLSRADSRTVTLIT